MLENERQKLQTLWVNSAEEDLKIAKDLYDLKHYHYCLFFCQLALEKLLKALFIKVNDTYPAPTHNLLQLAKGTSIVLDKSQKTHLEEITTFNIEARYDIHKERLYKKATATYTKEYLDVATRLFANFQKKL